MPSVPEFRGLFGGLMKTVKSLTQDELNKLIEFSGSVNGRQMWYERKITVRNLLAVLLMADAGLRVGEVLSLKIGNLWDHEKPGPRAILEVVTEKTNEPREIPLTKRIQDCLTCMFQFGWDSHRRSNPDLPAFTSHKGHGKSLSSRQLQRLLNKASKTVIGHRITPHMLRHTFATRLVQKNNNIRVIQILLGHQSITSTQIYTHPSSQDKLTAIETLS